MVTNVQTVESTTKIDVTGVDRRGANELALIGIFDTGAGGSSSANTVEKVRTVDSAETLFGSGSDMADGITDALQAGIPFVWAVGATETSKTGTTLTGTVDGANTTFNIPSADLPVHDVTDITVGGSSISGTISFTHQVPSSQSVAAGDALVNTDSGEVELGTAPTSSITGDYLTGDWDSAFDQAVLEGFEVAAAPGFTFQAQHWGVVEKFRSKADSEDLVNCWAYNSGVAPSDVEAITETYNTKTGAERTYIVAAHYTGDLTAAIAAHRAVAEVNATAKLQQAPTSITFSDTYLRSDYGDEEDPADGTFHEFGANAVFRDVDDAFRLSNDRAAQAYTSPSSGIRFFSDTRSIRLARTNTEDALVSVRKNSDTAFPFTEGGRVRIESVISNELDRLKQDDILGPGTSFVVPPPGDLTATEKEKRIWSGIDISLDIPGQVHLFKVTLNAKLA